MTQEYSNILHLSNPFPSPVCIRVAHPGSEPGGPRVRHQHPRRLLRLLRRGLPHRGEDSRPRQQLLLGEGRAHGETLRH